MGLGSWIQWSKRHRIPDPGVKKAPVRIPDPGVKKAPDPGSGSATLKYCRILVRMQKTNKFYLSYLPYLVCSVQNPR
jgi:hypothetical protein